MAMTAAEVELRIKTTGAQQAQRDMQQVGRSVDDTGRKLDAGAQKASGMSKALGTITTGAVIGGFGALAAGIAGTVSVAAGFEQALNNVSAATGATSEQLAAMRSEALKIGADTSKSASEAVAAMGELTKSGVSVQDAVGGVARTVVQMSEASGSSVAKMATLMSDSLNVFGLGADKAGDTANTLVKAAGASSISIDDLAYSLSAGGLVAKNAGLSIEQFSTAIGIMGNQGLKSSDAGTSLKAMIAGLTPTTDKAAGVMANLGIEVFDLQGNFKAFPDILAELAEGFAGLTQEQRANAAETLFGSDGIRAFNALVPDTAAGLKDASTQFAEFTTAMAQAPSVAEQSERRLQGLGGQVEKLKGSLETIGISVGTVALPPLTQFVGFLAENVGPAFDRFAEVLRTIAPLLGPIAAGFAAMAIVGGVAAAVTALSGAFTAFSAAVTLAGGVLPAVVAILGGPLTLAIVGIGAAVALLVVAWQRDWGGIQGKTEAVINAIQPILEALGTRLREFGDVILPELSAAWQNLSDNIGSIVGGIQGIVEPVFNGIRDFFNTHRTEITAIVQGLWDGIVVIFNTMTGIVSNNIQFWLNILQGDWQGAWDNLKNIVSIFWNGVKELVDIALGTVIPGAINLGKVIVKAAWDALWNELKASVNNAINGENGVIALVKAMPGAILGALEGIGTLLFNVGRDLISGFIAGVQDRWDDAVNFVKGLFDAVLKGVADVLDLGSPSRVAFGMGVDFIQGFIDGTSEMGGRLTEHVKRLVGGALSAAREAAGGLVGAAADVGRGALGAVGIGGGGGAGNAEGWIREAMRITGVDESWYAGLVRLMQLESGGNPNAVNPQAVIQNGVNYGHATGLFQTLPGTFAANNLTGGSITDPVANAVAAINYIRRHPNYGHVDRAVAGHAARGGYAAGGGVADGLFTVGERGFELGYKQGSQLHIFSNADSKALLSGMSGGSLRGFASGSFSRPDQFAAAVASPGGWTPDLASAWFEGMKWIADGMAAEREAWEALMVKQRGREVGDEIARFVAWLEQFGEPWLKEILASRGAEAAFEAYHGPGTIGSRMAGNQPLTVVLQLNGREVARGLASDISQEMTAQVRGTAGGYA